VPCAFPDVVRDCAAVLVVVPRSRLRDEIVAQIEADRSAGKPFRRAPRKVWERKDSAVRQCLSTSMGPLPDLQLHLRKRDAEPYFEGLSLLPF
jgi:hypothetical protein